MENKKVIKKLKQLIGDQNVLTSEWNKLPYSKGWRYGAGSALAVLKPNKLSDIWRILQICAKENIIIIMQAANTGLTGGSTPCGNDYDRPIIVINTMLINNIHIIKEGSQIVSLTGSTLYDLEKKLKPYGREPHSIIGSTSIGASIIGGICNNAGGSLVQRGPSYTEMALYAKINKNGNLELVNELGINLGSSPEEILDNLQNQNYKEADVFNTNKLGSDDKYSEIVRQIDKNTPSRFNSDSRLLYGASGSAGKIAVFAVRLDTYISPKENKVFYLGTNDPDVFWKIRRDILSKFKTLPTLGDYLHRDCYDAAKKYSKDTFLVIERLGTTFLPTLFELKRKVDIIAKKIKFLPNNFSDRLMQFLSIFFPNHLPKRMEKFRDLYEHHWIIEMSDDGISEARDYFANIFESNDGDFFECNDFESKKASLHRFVSASAIGRYHILNSKSHGEMMSLDIAFPRNEKNWFEKLPKEIDSMIEMKLYYGHLFCHVLHQNYILKKGVDSEKLKSELLKIYDERGAEYPAEHNVGHEYLAKPSLKKFYKELDPTNVFNVGIGRTSKNKNWT
ncbi:MAG: D-lactate dehydrogenase [Flavobacteriaceae bacterium]|nr:D-lactate dehydrogenase [Flavobacteriaceae bacterium]MDG2235266.1 D-lactate dehydrogenase [Flavobacteriaceae bacterium]|tara:strand:- start:3169 stop:4857 length:1689 start_codon:yes stop_codon:yes gene_type:complete